MSDNHFMHQDLQKEIEKIPKLEDIGEKHIKGILLRRTVGTSLITALVTFLLTASILLYMFYSYYMPELNAAGTNTINFDSEQKTKTSLDKLKLIIKNIKDNYVEKLTDDQIIEAISKGLPSALENPYTYYMSAKEYSSNTEVMSGKYAGIGCTVTYVENAGVTVVEVITDSPAQKAGLLQGDILITIDGVTVQKMKDPSEIAAKVKGIEGTKVKLEIYRSSTKEKKTFEIIRKTILYHNVNHKMLDNETGYVHVKAFAENVDRDFIAAMDDLQSKGAKNVVFDLRYNSGGNAQVMIDMLDYLLPKDTLLSSIKGRENGKPFEVKWVTKQKMMVPESMRYAILTNEYSASASEFFSGCLRDHKKAILIGKNTFGKGSGTKLYELPDGSAVNITIFKYYLPNGESIEGVGLKPDIEIDLETQLKSKPIETLTLKEDVQLTKAIEELKKTIK